MNRKHLTTIAWVSIAIATFALGWTLKSTPDASQISSQEEPPLIGNASLSLHPADEPNELSAEAETAAAAQLATLQTSPVLSSAQIEKLGATLMTSLDPIERRLAFAALLESLSVDNALEIRAQIENLPADSSKFREFHFAWGKIGGVDAIMHGADTDKPDMAATLAGWANADPTAAMSWLENLDMANDPGFDVLLKDRGLDPENLRNHFITGIVGGLASTDVNLASKFVFDMATAENQQQTEGLLHIVTSNVLRSMGATEAAQWAEDLPAGALRSTAMGRVAHELASEDPVAAAQWAIAYVYDEKGGHLVHGVTKPWARQDGEAAVAWLQSLNETPGRTGAYHSAFEGWAAQDPTAASNYLTTMPVSPERDMAIAGMVSRSRWEYPVAAIVWADSISSEKMRLETLTRAGQAWARKDYAAASEWAASSGLPEKLQRAIVSPQRDDRDRNRK